MAFASVGSRGTNTAKAAGATLSLSPTATIAAGQLLAVWASWDNRATDGIYSPILMCTDSVGNIYVTVFCDDPTTGGANTKPMGAIFLSRLRAQLATTDTLTITCGSALPVAKAVSLWEFSLTSSGFRWATSDRTANLRNIGVDPGAVTILGLDSQQYLLLHVLGAEAPSTDAYTWDADYTQITAAGTTGGAADTNITVLGGWRIATLTTDTVDVTSDTADRDYTQGLCAIAEIPEASFPTTPVLDSFTRADEDPLAAPAWEALTCTAGTGTGGLRLLSNVAARQAIGTGIGGQWWGTSVAQNDAEVFATMTTAPTVAGDLLGLGLHGAGCGNAGNRTGYGLEWTKKPSANAAGDYITIDKAGFAAITKHALIWRDVAAGNKLGVQRKGKVNSVWLDVGAGWEWVAAVYHTLATESFSSGKLGLILHNTSPRADDFGGGAIPSLGHLLPLLHVGS